MSYKLKAIHEIIRGNTGKREVIAPGVVFSADKAEGDSLLRLGAAVQLAASAESVVQQLVQDDTGVATTQEPEGTEGTEGTVDNGADADAPQLPSMTVAQLREYADARGIEVKDGLKKAEILAVIEAAEEDII